VVTRYNFFDIKAKMFKLQFHWSHCSQLW